MQEKRIEDYWNADSNSSLSDSWTGFTKITLLKETLPKGYVWSGERLTKVLATTQCVARSMDQNWESRSEKGKRQSSTTVQLNNSKDIKKAITVSIQVKVGSGFISPRTVHRHQVGKELHGEHLHHQISNDFCKVFLLTNINDFLVCDG